MLLALLASGCNDGRGAAETAAAPPAPVSVAAVERKTVPLTFTAIGNVLPIEECGGQIPHRRADRCCARDRRPGSTQGQRLFDLDRRYLEAQLKQLEAQEARDRALLANARSMEQRYIELQAKGFVSEEALTQARTTREAAEATVAADSAMVETARVQLSYARIDAPISGRAGRVALQLGNTVAANDSEPLVVSNRLAPIHVNFAIPERLLAQVRNPPRGTNLRVTVIPEGDPAPIAGRLTFIDNAVDARTGTIRLHATFDNADQRLWPGQFVTTTLTLQEQADALVVPSQAIQNGPNGQYVFVVKADDTAEMRPVKVERTEGADAVIAEGVTPGERVITVGQLRVTPGTKVSVRQG